MSSFLEMLASYQGNRSQCLKDKRETQNIALDDFFSEGEREELLHQRTVSRYVSHCNFAIDCISVQGESINPELIVVLTEQEQRIIRMRIENRLGFLEIGKQLDISTGMAKGNYEKALRKLTKHIRSIQEQSVPAN